MQLIIIVLAAFGLGYWFARSDASERLTKTAKDLGGRWRRKPVKDQTETTQAQVSSSPEAETA